MNSHFFDIDELSSDERDRVVKRLKSDDDFRREYLAWTQVATLVREEQDQVLGDTEVLVAYALETERESLLSETERTEVAAARTRLDAAAQNRPAVADIIARIRQDADLFDEVWQGSTRRSRAIDRGARPHRAHFSAARIGWRVAALAATVVFVGILLFIAQRDSGKISIEVADGAIEEVSMRDGTNIRLVGPATLSYVTSESVARPGVVELAGGGYFDVVGGGVPFVIRTATARISVLGTNFGVRAYPEATDVVLASGRLSVSSLTDDTGMILESGFASTVVAGQPPSPPQAVDLTDALSWAGLFVFRGTTVAEIADRLSEHHMLNIAVGLDLGPQLVSGTFDRNREIQEVLDVLASSLGASVVPTDDGFLLTATHP